MKRLSIMITIWAQAGWPHSAPIWNAYIFRHQVEQQCGVVYRATHGFSIQASTTLLCFAGAAELPQAIFLPPPPPHFCYLRIFEPRNDNKKGECRILRVSGDPKLFRFLGLLPFGHRRRCSAWPGTTRGTCCRRHARGSHLQKSRRCRRHWSGRRLVGDTLKHNGVRASAEGQPLQPQAGGGGRRTPTAPIGRPLHANQTSNQTSAGSLVFCSRLPRFSNFPFHFPFRGEKGSDPHGWG